MRELASTHILERMQRLRMLEEQEAWKRGAGFDRIEIIAETREQRLYVGFDSEPLCTGLYNPRWPYTSEEYTLEISVDIERLRLEALFFSQLAPPPQFDSSPRRSPAVGAGSDGPGVPRAETQKTAKKGSFPVQARVDDVLHVSCTSPE